MQSDTIALGTKNIFLKQLKITNDKLTMDRIDHRESSRFDVGVGIVIIGVENLQTHLFAEFVSSSFNCSTVIVKPKANLDLADCEFVLVDCSVYMLDEYRFLLADIPDLFPDVNGALFNVPKNSCLKSLVNYQWIKGIFYSDTSKKNFLNGMKNMLDDKLWFPRDITDSLIEQLRKPPIQTSINSNLTTREKEILELLVNANSNKQIARELELSEHTIKTHLYHIFKKIGARNRLEAVNLVSLNRMD